MSHHSSAKLTLGKDPKVSTSNYILVCKCRTKEGRIIEIYGDKDQRIDHVRSGELRAPHFNNLRTAKGFQVEMTSRSTFKILDLGIADCEIYEEPDSDPTE